MQMASDIYSRFVDSKFKYLQAKSQRCLCINLLRAMECPEATAKTQRLSKFDLGGLRWIL